MNEEIIIQDILKHFAECEYDRRPIALDGLAGELSIPRDQLDRVLGDLESAGLVEPDALKLTDSGQEYALHVLRAHRLYETFLARKTGVHENDWHTHAHVEEHKLSTEDVEQLARDLNYPRFDPHGDPIPTADGAMPPKRGKPLTEYPVGWEGRVFHVEDDPPSLYVPIAEAGISPGTVLRVGQKSEHQLEFSAEGCTFRLPTDSARQVAVVPLEEGEHFDASLQRLSSLDKNEDAAVAGLSSRCRGLERSRLLDLGVVPGTVISIDLISPSGSPIAYRIRGASIALRRDQADRVLIRRTKEKTHG